MTTKQKFLSVYIFVILLLVSAGVAAYLMTQNQLALQKEKDRHLSSYELTNYVTKFSDDLTNFARIYTMTSNPVYKQKYQETLDVFDGKRPGADGRKLSVADRMTLLEFTNAEKEKLGASKKASAELAVIETDAFKMLENKNHDTNLDPAKAEVEKRLALVDAMFGNKYRSYKNRINDNSKEFFAMVQERNEQNVASLKAKANTLLIVVLVLLAIVIFIVIYSFILISRKIVRDNI